MRTYCTRSSATLLFLLMLIVTTFAADAGRVIEEKRHQQWTEMMGKPIVNSTSEGLHLTIWLFSQRTHRKMMDKGLGSMLMGGMEDSTGKNRGMMKGIHGEEMKLEKTVMDALMGGTHHLMIVAKDASTGSEFVSPTAQVKFVAPSSKETMIDLPLVMGHFAEGITLSEKGRYRFFLEVTANGFSRERQFTYTVR